MGILTGRVAAMLVVVRLIVAVQIVAVLVLASFIALAMVSPVHAAPPEKYAGTWRIQGATQLEGQGLFHFFYLHPSGGFLLAAEWPGHETSRFAGHWSVAGNKLYLSGKGDVETNQGNWRVDFQRTFTIVLHDSGYRIEPRPDKNRFGLLGWPNAFEYHRRRPTPNLPGIDLPLDEKEMLELIKEWAPNTAKLK